MPIISTIGRHAPKVRLLVGGIYLVLLAGSITMIYPFLLMISGSTKSNVDTPDATVIPPFLAGDEGLWRKHVEGLFNESLEQMQYAYGESASGFQLLSLPGTPNPLLADCWREFVTSAPLPSYAYTIGYLAAGVTRGVVPHNLREFKRRLADRFGDDILKLNRELGTEFVGWNSLTCRAESYLLQREKPRGGGFALALKEFKAACPLAERYYFSAEGFYKAAFLKTQYGKEIAGYNAAHGTNYASWDEVHLDRALPDGPGRTDAERKDWEEFVRAILSSLWVRARPEAAGAYREYLQAKYGQIAALNRAYETGYADFAALAVPDTPPAGGLAASDWEGFIQGWKDPATGKLHRLPTADLRVQSTDFLFRDFMAAKFGALSEANHRLGLQAKSWLDILPPQRDFHYLAFQERRGALRWEFVKRNFATVVDYIVLHGRGLLNTVIYCSLAVLAALIVNPLAAYALSRYRPPSTYKILLFLMLTMAFPPAVTQIPVFLMLREFSLLNTFAALLLPGLASGYSVFLLKGFFDSLPKELYESAEIDGASEFRIFWQITMSLSTPILAVIALQAFTTAYANFMMALLICQDEQMWTLMPWLYQLQQRSGQGVIYASLLIAAIPTFAIFVCCQNVIMRGIVVPVEK